MVLSEQVKLLSGRGVALIQRVHGCRLHLYLWALTTNSYPTQYRQCIIWQIGYREQKNHEACSHRRQRNGTLIRVMQWVYEELQYSSCRRNGRSNYQNNYFNCRVKCTFATNLYPNYAKHNQVIFRQYPISPPVLTWDINHLICSISKGNTPEAWSSHIFYEFLEFTNLKQLIVTNKTIIWKLVNYKRLNGYLLSQVSLNALNHLQQASFCMNPK